MDAFCRRKEIVWSLFLFCSVANIYSTYKSVQDLPLTTLNLNRIEKASEPLIQEYQQQFVYCIANSSSQPRLSSSLLTPEQVAKRYLLPRLFIIVSFMNVLILIVIIGITYCFHTNDLIFTFYPAFGLRLITIENSF